MAMEMYSRRGCVPTGGPAVMMGKRGLYFNKAAVEQFLDINFLYALLGYDRETGQIGIQLQKEKSHDALSFNFNKEKKEILNAALGTTGFIKRFKLEHFNRRQFKIEKAEKMLLLTSIEEATSPAKTESNKTLRPESTTTDGNTKGQWKCSNCGYKPGHWKYQYKDGHPMVCGKCRGLTFEPVK